MPTRNRNFQIYICSPDKGQCGTRAEASSAHSHHWAPAQQSNWCLSSQPPKLHLEQELSYFSLGLDASMNNMSVYDISQDGGEVQVCAQLSVGAGDSSLALSDSQWAHGVSLLCWRSVLQPLKTLYHTAHNAWAGGVPSHVFGGRGKDFWPP